MGWTVGIRSGVQINGTPPHPSPPVCRAPACERRRAAWETNIGLSHSGLRAQPAVAPKTRQRPRKREADMSAPPSP